MTFLNSFLDTNCPKVALTLISRRFHTNPATKIFPVNFIRLVKLLVLKTIKDGSGYLTPNADNDIGMFNVFLMVAIIILKLAQMGAYWVTGFLVDCRSH
jgi:hypothetical protein